MYKLEWIDDPFMVASKATLLHQGEPILEVKIVMGDDAAGYYFRFTLQGFYDPQGWLGVFPCGPFGTAEEAKRAALAFLPEWLAFRARQAKQILGPQPPALLSLWSSPDVLAIKRDAALIMQIDALLTNSNSEVA
jgi:hypothetical protein